MKKVIVGLGEPTVDSYGYIVKGPVNEAMHLKNISDEEYEVWYKLIWKITDYDEAEREYNMHSPTTPFSAIINSLEDAYLVAIGEDDTHIHAAERAMSKTRIQINPYTTPCNIEEMYWAIIKSGEARRHHAARAQLDRIPYDAAARKFKHTNANTRYSELVDVSSEGMPEISDVEDAKVFVCIAKCRGTLTQNELAWYMANGYGIGKDMGKNKFQLNTQYLKEGQREMSVDEMRARCSAWDKTMNSLIKIYNHGWCVLVHKDRVFESRVKYTDSGKNQEGAIK